MIGTDRRLHRHTDDRHRQALTQTGQDIHTGLDRQADQQTDTDRQTDGQTLMHIHTYPHIIALVSRFVVFSVALSGVLFTNSFFIIITCLG